MIAIINYGLGNLGSIKNMLTRLGFEAVITGDPQQMRAADKLILPGVGAFDSAMINLDRFGMIGVLNELVLDRKVPILGICLGMQILSRRSEEGTLPGLGWLDSETVRFRFDEGERKLKVPHMGWNEIEIKRNNPLLAETEGTLRFYFVHSYHMRCSDPADLLATSRHGIEFAAAVNRGNVWGMQFHPEKSHKFGLKVLKNFGEM